MARKFNGASDSIIVDAALTSPSWWQDRFGRTYAFWIKAAAAQSNVFMYSEGVIGNNNDFWGLSIVSGGTNQLRWSGGTNFNTIGATSTAVIADSTWHHCALTIDTSGNPPTTGNRFNMYVDGVLDQTGVMTSANSGGGTTTLAAIGGLRRATTQTNFVNALLAHFAIWNRTLSAEEVRMLARGHLPSQFDPQNYWALTGPDTNVARSTGRRRNHGTLVGTTVSGDTPPVIPRPARRRYYIPQQKEVFATAFNGKATFAAVVTAYQRIVSSLTGTSTLTVTLREAHTRFTATLAGTSTFTATVSTSSGTVVAITPTLAGTSTFTVKLSQPHLYPLFDGTSTFTVAITEAGAPHIIATFAGVGTLTFGEDLGPPGLRLSQAVFEVLGSPDNIPVRLSQVTVEVARPRRGLHIWGRV